MSPAETWNTALKKLRPGDAYLCGDTEVRCMRHGGRAGQEQRRWKVTINGEQKVFTYLKHAVRHILRVRYGLEST